MANVLKALGVKKGDRVCIYLPMVPKAAVAMLACARIGAIHSVGLRRLLARQPSATASRTATASIVITADEGLRGGKVVPLKECRRRRGAMPQHQARVVVKPHRRRRRR
jgi:acetyl-CoA synthetase